MEKIRVINGHNELSGLTQIAYTNTERKKEMQILEIT